MSVKINYLAFNIMKRQKGGILYESLWKWSWSCDYISIIHTSYNHSWCIYLRV
jgi:hypothetical protein